MYLEIVTPEEIIYSEEIKSVIFPGSSGSFGVLKKHAPIISTLESGVIKIVNLIGEVIQYDIEIGVVEVVDDNVVVLIESCDKIS